MSDFDNESISSIKNTPTPVTLTATDPNNDPLTYIVTQSHTVLYHHQLLAIHLERITPATGYTGPDSFTFKANDGTVDSNTATVTINVIEQDKEVITMHQALS